MLQIERSLVYAILTSRTNLLQLKTAACFRSVCFQKRRWCQYNRGVCGFQHFVHHRRVCSFRGQRYSTHMVASVTRLLLLSHICHHPHCSSLRRTCPMVGIGHPRYSVPVLYPTHGPQSQHASIYFQQIQLRFPNFLRRTSNSSWHSFTKLALWRRIAQHLHGIKTFSWLCNTFDS